MPLKRLASDPRLDTDDRGCWSFVVAAVVVVAAAADVAVVDASMRRCRDDCLMRRRGYC